MLASVVFRLVLAGDHGKRNATVNVTSDAKTLDVIA